MTPQQFIAQLREKFSFTYEDENFGFVKLEGDELLAYDDKMEIRAINFIEIYNETLGFRMDRILDLESSNELLLISGTETKDGVYYLNYESSLITVEELESDEDAKTWIEDWLNLPVEKFLELSPDNKVALLEDEVGIFLVENTLEEFLAKVAFTTGDKYYWE